MAVIRCKLRVKHKAIKDIEEAQKRALYKTADAMLTDVIQSQVMPFDTGTMQNDSTYLAASNDGKKVSLITRTPYALKLYYHPEYNFQKTNNKNAQALWYESYINGENKDFCEEQFAEFMKREL